MHSQKFRRTRNSCVILKTGCFSFTSPRVTVYTTNLWKHGNHLVNRAKKKSNVRSRISSYDVKREPHSEGSDFINVQCLMFRELKRDNLRPVYIRAAPTIISRGQRIKTESDIQVVSLVTDTCHATCLGFFPSPLFRQQYALSFTASGKCVF